MGPGFDLARLCLASAVVLVHSDRAVNGAARDLSPIWFTTEMIVPMFFVLSGFLVTASAEKHSLPNYARNRFLRIYPAFLLCVLLSALLMGPLVTRLPVSEYFAAPGFRDYLRVLIGWPEFFLPGVFEELPDAGMVNVSLWTVRWELACYIGLGIAAALGILRRTWLAAAIVACIALAPAAAFVVAHAVAYLSNADIEVLSVIRPHAFYFVEPVPLPDSDPLSLLYWSIEVLASWNFRIVQYFAAGSLFYLLRYRIAFSGRLAVAMAAMLVIGNIALPAQWNGPLVYLLACAPATYLVIWFGMSDLRVPRWLARGDYSYGVYLFHFPILQLVRLTGLDQGLWWLNFLIGFPLVLLMAMVSWHSVEYPLLRNRSGTTSRFVPMPAR